MYKVFIKIRKYLYLKPKFKYIRITNKIIRRDKLELLMLDLETRIGKLDNETDRAFLRGQIKIIKFLLE